MKKIFIPGILFLIACLYCSKVPKYFPTNPHDPQNPAYIYSLKLKSNVPGYTRNGLPGSLLRPFSYLRANVVDTANTVRNLNNDGYNYRFEYVFQPVFYKGALHNWKQDSVRSTDNTSFIYYECCELVPDSLFLGVELQNQQYNNDDGQQVRVPGCLVLSVNSFDSMNTYIRVYLFEKYMLNSPGYSSDWYRRFEQQSMVDAKLRNISLNIPVILRAKCDDEGSYAALGYDTLRMSQSMLSGVNVSVTYDDALNISTISIPPSAFLTALGITAANGYNTVQFAIETMEAMVRKDSVIYDTLHADTAWPTVAETTYLAKRWYISPFTFGNLIYLAGSDGDSIYIEAYNPVMDTFCVKASKKVTYEANYAYFDTLGGSIYAFLGTSFGTSTITVVKYDVLTNSWANVDTFGYTGGYRLLGAKGLNGKVYFFTYQGSNFITIKFDPLDNSWVPIDTLSRSYSDNRLNSWAQNGKIYHIDGNVQEFDTASKNWTEKMFFNGYDAATLAAGQRCYIIGGASGYIPLDSVYLYDPLSDTRTAKAKLPQARRAGGACFFYDGKIYVFGGDTAGGSNSFTNTILVYDTSANLWSYKNNPLSVTYKQVMVLTSLQIDSTVTPQPSYNSSLPAVNTYQLQFSGPLENRTNLYLNLRVGRNEIFTCLPLR